MADRLRLCSIADCRGPVKARGWCNKHLQRWAKHGDPLCDRRRKWPVDSQCSIEGCAAPINSRGLCEKHYTRRLRHGDPLVTYPGAQRMATTGYRFAPGCQEYEHREVLLAKIGPGTHECYWCAREVAWGVDLTTDHLDSNKLNNEPANLVPACQSCNMLHYLALRYGRMVAA